MKTRRVVFLLSALLIGLFGLYLFIPEFLALNRPVESHHVLLEAWIPASEIELAAHTLGKDPGTDFFVTGYKFPILSVADLPSWPSDREPVTGHAGAGIWLYANSSLEIRLPDEIAEQERDTVDLVLEARGQGAAGQGAYFKVVINGQIAESGFAGGGIQSYPFKWVRRGQSFESLFVRFNNDLKTDTADRNLQVVALVVEGVRIDANVTNTRITREMNNLTTGFASQAGETADYLCQIGISADRVHHVDFNAPDRNLTLAAARAFRDYPGRTGIGSFNVVSSGLHCRRTWLSYQKVFGDEVAVGVVNFHPEGFTRKNEYGNRPFIFNLADEYFSYLLTWTELNF